MGKRGPDGERRGFPRAGIALLAALVLSACPSTYDLGPIWIETGIAAGDLDGDTLQDVVTVASYSHGYEDKVGILTVYLQTAQGTFAAPYQITSGRYPWRVKIADVDGNGAPDLVVLDVVGGHAAHGVVYLLLQDTNNRGRFLAPRVIAEASTQFYDFALADLDKDGALDLVLATGLGGGDGAQVLYQRLAQRGSFEAPVAIPLPGRASQVAVGHLNHDEDDWVDLAFYATTAFDVNTGSSGNAMLVYGQPGRSFSSAVVLVPQVGLNAQLVEICDVDGNGLNDVLIAFTPFSTDYRAKLTVLLQTAAGNFAAVDSSLAAVSGMDGFVVADLNHDGRPDVATTGFFPTGSPTVVRSRANVLVPVDPPGAFGLAAVYELGAAMSRITAADVDGDGGNDLLLLGGDNGAFVMPQSTTVPGTFMPPRQL